MAPVTDRRSTTTTSRHGHPQAPTASSDPKALGPDFKFDGIRSHPHYLTSGAAALVGWFAQYPLSQDCQGGAGPCGLLAALFSDPHYIATALGQVLREVELFVGEYQ
jgi:hypothetical protein